MRFRTQDKKRFSASGYCYRLSISNSGWGQDILRSCGNRPISYGFVRLTYPLTQGKHWLQGDFWGRELAAGPAGPRGAGGFDGPRRFISRATDSATLANRTHEVAVSALEQAARNAAAERIAQRKEVDGASST